MMVLTVLGGEATLGMARGGARPLMLRLRGGKSLGGSAGQGLPNLGAAAQGVQLPMLRNVLDLTTSLTAASNASAAGAAPVGSMDPERMQFLRNAFAEMLENTTDVFATAISRLTLPEDCEANISLKQRALDSIAGWQLGCVSVMRH